MVKSFNELTIDLKTDGLNPGFHVLDNEASTSPKNITTFMDIKYQLFTPGDQRDNSTEISIHTFKKHFIEGLCSVYMYFYLQLWDRMLQQETTTLNMLRQ